MDRPWSKAMVVVAVLALFEGGYLVVDAVHRFATGDFLLIFGTLASIIRSALLLHARSRSSTNRSKTET